MVGSEKMTPIRHEPNNHPRYELWIPDCFALSSGVGQEFELGSQWL